MNGTYGQKVNDTYMSNHNKTIFTRQPRNSTIGQEKLNLLQLHEVIFCYSEYLQLIDCDIYAHVNNSCKDGFVFAEFPDTTKYVTQLRSETMNGCN
ncbi:hypothetical protein MN116_004518 [Schistosoma mekongi]|uniref:Uncharacterized protein n=1 Tax=Schistosoma mekongi TaxID=38744 RepID=A0AAE1ZGV8_SCHME|nr:hypothetical protein MN116_004518 [Schistosoma mekongi]